MNYEEAVEPYHIAAGPPAKIPTKRAVLHQLESSESHLSGDLPTSRLQ